MDSTSNNRLRDMTNDDKFHKGETKGRTNNLFKKEVYSKLSKLDDIHKALVGDEYGNEGIISAVKKNTNGRNEYQSDKHMIAKVGKWAAGLVSSGGILSWLSWDHIKHIF